jgi:hypothetical protein
LYIAYPSLAFRCFPQSEAIDLRGLVVGYIDGYDDAIALDYIGAILRTLDLYLARG